MYFRLGFELFLKNDIYYLYYVVGENKRTTLSQLNLLCLTVTLTTTEREQNQRGYDDAASGSIIWRLAEVKHIRTISVLQD